MPDGILAAVAAGDRPTMILGVPFHAELLTSVAAPPPLPQLARMVVAGELVRPHVPGAFTARYGVPLGTMYGMTELGVIATDLHGRHHPAVTPAPGMALRVEAGELLVAMAASPYIGLVDPTRWSDGWLHTRDAAAADPATGLVTILGRLDLQVSIGGLKVDLTEVEQSLAALPEVTEVVVVYDDVIRAYLALRDGAAVAGVERAITEQLAAFKRPRDLHVLPSLPRTASGKIVRDRAVLRLLLPASRWPGEPSRGAGQPRGPAAPRPPSVRSLVRSSAVRAACARHAQRTHFGPGRPGSGPAPMERKPSRCVKTRTWSASSSSIPCRR